VRYVFTICILFVHLVRCFTAEAETPDQHIISQKKDAVVSSLSGHHDPTAELARSIHFNCTRVPIRDHRLQENVPATDNLGSYIAEALRKRAIVQPASPRFPLKRLLLFPNHYFW
jgi:hypothetical protein